MKNKIFIAILIVITIFSIILINADILGKSHIKRDDNLSYLKDYYSHKFNLADRNYLSEDIIIRLIQEERNNHNFDSIVSLTYNLENNTKMLLVLDLFSMSSDFIYRFKDNILSSGVSSERIKKNSVLEGYLSLLDGNDRVKKIEFDDSAINELYKTKNSDKMLSFYVQN